MIVTSRRLHYYHRTQQYSITALTNGGGSITERYAYSAYGTPTITDAAGTIRTVSTDNNRYTYTGREYDEALGLYHYRARMYDPSAGRFCSRDPIGYGDGVLLYANRFGLAKLDPSGMSSRTVTQSEVAAGCDLMVRCTATDWVFEHCGLSIQLDNGRIIHIDGTRGNDVEVLDVPRMPRPSDIETRTRISGQNCACLINSGIGWWRTPRSQRPRNHVTGNSNWVLKCVMKKCSMGIN